MTGSLRSRVAPIAAAYGLVMAASYVLKPVRNSLFLDRQGIGQLPLVAGIVAVVGAGAGALYARVSGRVPVGKLVTVSLGVVILCLLLFRLALAHPAAWLVYAFYVWVSTYGLVATSLMWLLAGSAFDAREARRSFGVIGAAGIAGAVAGGLGTRAIVGAIGTENLLLVCVATLLPCLPLVRMVRPAEVARPSRREPESRGSIAALLRSDLLRSIAWTMILCAAVSVIIDIQFNEVVDRMVPDRDQKTAFFGTFFATLSAVAFVAQLVLAPRLLALRGVGAALLVLPLALAAGSAAFFFVPVLWAAALARGSEGAFRHSIHKAATEILLVPVPEELKRRTKLTLDASVSTFGEGLGAALVLVLTGVAGLPYRYLSVLCLALIAGWMLLHRRLLRAYLDAFRRALERREIDPSALRTSIAEASTIGHLEAFLASGNERQISYALDLLGAEPEAALARAVTPLLDHPSADVKKRALRILVAAGAEGDPAQLERLRRDPDPDVRLDAIRLERRALDHDPERIAALLAHEDPLVQAAAIDWVAQDGSAEQQARVEESRVRGLLAHDGTVRAQVARALGSLEGLRDVLHELTVEPRVLPEVVHGAGRSRDPRFVPWLVARLGDGRLRVAARAALALHGRPALAALDDALGDPARPRALRGQVPRAMAAIGEQESVDRLLNRLGDPSVGLELPIAKALNRMRERYPALRFDPAAIEALVLAVAARLDEIDRAAAACRALPDAPLASLLRRALADKGALLREHAFRLLGLRQPARVMRDAHHGLVSGDRALRASALEYLDTVLSPRLKVALVPVLERGTTISGLDPSEALRRLCGDRDPWLRACAVATARAIAPPGVDALVARARDDADPMVREVAGA